MLGAACSGMPGAVVLFGLLAVLTLVRGGFFATAATAAGVVALAVAGVCWARTPRTRRRVGIVPLLFACLAVAYLASALVSGLTLTTLAEAGSWCAVAGMAAAFPLQSERGRTWMLDALCWFAAGCAVFSAFVFVEAVPTIYGVADDRLQFPFQYANAAAVWFGAAVLLCLLSSKPLVRCLVPPMVCALLLTKSAGAAAVFALMCLAVAVYWWVKGRWAAIVGACVQMIAGSVAFVLIDATRATWCTALGMAVLAGVCATYALCVLPDGNGGRRLVVPKALCGKGTCIALAAVIAAGCAGVFALYSGRLLEAASHFFTRWVYVADAARMVSAAPLLGAGPDNWQHLYPQFASAQYAVSVVHCSYAQVACDAGLVGLALLCAAVVLGCVALARRRDVRGLVAALMLALHSVVDFDLQFGALAGLLALLLCDGCGPSIKVGRGFGWAPWAASAALLTGCIAGFACGAMRSVLTAAAVVGDDGSAERVYLGNPLAYNDVGARDDYLQALYRAGRYEDVALSCAAYGVSTAGQAQTAAWALAELGMSDEGLSLLVQMAEIQPYNAVLLNEMGRYASEHGIPESLLERYTAVVERANRLAGEGNAALLGDQVTFVVPQGV